jgi:hypothetical protein
VVIEDLASLRGRPRAAIATSTRTPASRPPRARSTSRSPRCAAQTSPIAQTHVVLGRELRGLERLVVEMYARGLSTRDVEDRSRDATGTCARCATRPRSRRASRRRPTVCASPYATASNVRTTNLLERSFEEERRRSKVVPRFSDEKSAMKLVFATLMCAGSVERCVGLGAGATAAASATSTARPRPTA